jgi:membrane protease YdiL (CAAX protease family)
MQLINSESGKVIKFIILKYVVATKMFWLAILIAISFWAVLILTADYKANLSWVIDHPETLLWYVFLMPLIEELAFRGYLQEALNKKFIQMVIAPLNISLANVLTSVVFAILHLVTYQSAMAAATFFPSLVFGVAKDTYRSVLPGYLIHMLYNFGFISVIVY